MERIQPLIFRVKHSLQRLLPRWLYQGLFVHKYAHFFATGVAGVAMNLLLTWGFTEFVFGIENYFSAYIIGICANLLFNFIVHLRVTFQTQRHVAQRMVGFVAYSLSMTIFQTWVVKTLVGIIGLQYYLFVIAGVILSFSFVTFLLFKFFLFRNSDPKQEEQRLIPQLLLVAMFSSVLLHVTGLLEVLSGKGLEVLLVGDGTGYLELAKNLRDGHGFGVFRPEGWIPEVFRTPGLPSILAPFMGLPYGIEIYIFLQTILAGILLPLFVYFIGKKVFSERAGMIGAWLIALEPQMMFSSWSPLTEIPFLFCVLPATLVLISFRGWSGTTVSEGIKLATAGLLLTAAIYIRPGTALLIAVLLGGFILEALFKKDRHDVLRFVAVSLLVFTLLLPWQTRNEGLTGASSLSGAGWRNVYVDFVGSLRTIRNNTEFYSERSKLKDEAVARFAMDSRRDVDSPKYADELRGAAIEEIMRYPVDTVKLGGLLLVTFFTNDNYYNQLIRLGFIPSVKDRVSPTQLLLREGIEGIPRIYEEMKKQYFVPIISRLYQFTIVLLALWGAWRAPRGLALILVSVIGIAAITATVIGLGLEIRLRMPIMPILFLLVGHAIATGLPIPAFLRRMKPHES